MTERKEEEGYEAPEIFELGRAEELTLGKPMGGWPDDFEQFIKPQPPYC